MNTISTGTTVYVVQEQGGMFVFLTTVDRDDFATKEREGGAIELVTGTYVTREDHNSLNDVADEVVEYFD